MTLQTIQTWLFRIFILSLAFSFQPVINLGQASGLNVEIGAVQIVGGLFIVSMLPVLWVARTHLFRNKLVWGLLLIGFLAIASIGVSGAVSRSVSLAAYTAFLVVIVLSVATYVAGDEVGRRTDAMKALVLASGFSALFGLWQFIGDALGWTIATTRLLPEYTSVVFGFARPQALLAEPQYLAGLLVVGIGATMVLQQIKPTRASWNTSALLWLMLWLTLSRGGFIAVAVAGLVLFGLGRNQKKVMDVVKKQLYIGVAIMVVALLMVGWAGQQYTKDNQGFVQSIQRYIEHASLSSIDFADSEIADTDVAEPTVNATSQQQAPKTTQKTISSTITDTSGEIEASRVGRQEAVLLGVEVATQSPKNFVFGVGVGGFGAAANEIDQQYSEDIVVNNQYVNALVETGVIGLMLLIGFLGWLAWLLYSQASKNSLVGRQSVVLLSVFAGVHVQYIFFSTLTNATYVWLLYGLVIGQALAKKSK